MLGLMLLLLACTSASSRLRAEDGGVPPAPTAEEAVQTAVEQTGALYAGDCSATRSPDDAGKMCSKFVEERGATRAYLIGRTFSEFSLWLFVQQSDAGWRATAMTPLDFQATSIQIPWP